MEFEFKFKGKTYIYLKGHFRSKNGDNIGSALESQIINAYCNSIDFVNKDDVELFTIESAFKEDLDRMEKPILNDKMYKIPLRCLLECYKRDVTITKQRYWYPSLVADYRKYRMYTEAIKLIKHIEENKLPWTHTNHFFYTAAAAAYCDINDFNTADVYAINAYKELKGHPDEAQKNVKSRIIHKSGPEDSERFDLDVSLEKFI